MSQNTNASELARIDEVKNSIVNIYKNHSVTQNNHQVTIKDLLDIIRTGYLYKLNETIPKLRQAAKEFGKLAPQTKDIKNTLPAVVFSLDCNHRVKIESRSLEALKKKIDTLNSYYEFTNYIDTKEYYEIVGSADYQEYLIKENSKFKKHNNLYQIDIDKIPYDKISQVKAEILKIPYTYSCFLSPTGTGLKVMVYCNSDIQLHKEYNVNNKHTMIWYYIKQYYESNITIFEGMEFDNSVRDLYRLCYLSYDPEIYVNDNVKSFINDNDYFNSFMKDENQILHKSTTNNDKSKDNNNINNEFKAPPKQNGTSKSYSYDYTTEKNNELLNKKINQVIDTCHKMLRNAVKGDGSGNNRNMVRLKVGKLLGGYIAGGWISEAEAINEIKNEVASNTDLSIDVALKDIYNGIKVGLYHPITKDEYLNYIDNLKKQNKENKRFEKINIIEAAKLNKNINADNGEAETTIIKFWDEVQIGKSKKFEAKISEVKLYQYFMSKGFHLFIINGIKTLCKVSNKIISLADASDLQQCLTLEIMNMNPQISENLTAEDLQEKVSRSVNTLFSSNKYSSHFIAKQVKINKDTKESAFFYFINCYVEVKRSSIEIKDYIYLDGYVWEKQIINHKLTRLNYEEHSQCDFAMLLQNLCTDKMTGEIDIKRLKALLCSFGYLVHDYRFKSLAKAIVSTEIKINKDANGRTGKGLFVQALKKLRNVVKLDGKSFHNSIIDKFAMQRVRPDTQIIWIDDLKEGFDWELLFSILTDGLGYEQKGKDAVQLEYSESPKFYITYNYLLKLKGKSAKDRFYEMETMPYYTDTFKPIDEFKKEFFDDWNVEEYNRFYNFVFWIVQTYLNSVNIDNNFRMPEYKTNVLSLYETSLETSEQFVEYFKNIEYGQTYIFKDLYNDYIEQTKDNISKSMFSKYIEKYCECLNLNGGESIKKWVGDESKTTYTITRK